jgi:hypothetical protein
MLYKIIVRFWKRIWLCSGRGVDPTARLEYGEVLYSIIGGAKHEQAGYNSEVSAILEGCVASASVTLPPETHLAYNIPLYFYPE